MTAMVQQSQDPFSNDQDQQRGTLNHHHLYDEDEHMICELRQAVTLADEQ